MQIVQSQKFEVVEGSKTEQAILDHRFLSEQAMNAWDAFAKKHGAEKIYAGDSLCGLVFNGAPPDGWVRADRRVRAFRPALKRPLTDDAKEFKALPSKPSMLEWLDMLGLKVVSLGGSFKSPGYKFEDGRYYLTAKEGCPIPDDVKPA